MKVNTSLLCYPAIPLLRIYPRKMKTYIPTKPHAQVFITALAIIAKSSTMTLDAYKKKR
jgi:hypothetical protein